ncbi:MAG TPA: NADPH dehydrogenase NamA [Candidatus Eisenbacteria bacterium]|nr:NADPH dehydrogenase NamA [Candidatus Eisenbacteria bacterium]
MKDLQIKNRIVMAPMCLFSSNHKGQVLDLHHIHYGSRAIGGTGLIIQEATAVLPEGRITDRDLGIWDDAYIDGLRSLVKVMHDGGAKAAIQIAHAGRKCGVKEETTLAPSAIDFSQDYPLPQAMSLEEIKQTIQAFGKAADRSVKAGYDLIEIHAAHGYLIHQFLSPLSNHRTDDYGGSFENRIRFLKEIIDEIRLYWPKERALAIRLSAIDYLEGGLTLEDTCKIVDLIKEDVDLFHLSSGGLLDASFPIFPGYQINFAEEVKKICKVPTIAVGLIKNLDQTEEILGNQRADLIALGRKLLRNPYWPIQQLKLDTDTTSLIPEAYRRAW